MPAEAIIVEDIIESKRFIKIFSLSFGICKEPWELKYILVNVRERDKGETRFWWKISEQIRNCETGYQEQDKHSSLIVLQVIDLKANWRLSQWYIILNFYNVSSR